MRRLWIVVAGALVAVLAPRPAPGGGDALSFFASIGGGVQALDTGAVLAPAPEEEPGRGGSTTVLPYRAGARYRVPVMLVPAAGADHVRVTDVRVAGFAGGYVEAAGAVLGAHCCALEGALPFAPVELGRGQREDAVVVGLDLRLRPGAPAGWVERVPGYAVTYQWRGVTRRVLVPFADIQGVVVRG